MWDASPRSPHIGLAAGFAVVIVVAVVVVVAASVLVDSGSVVLVVVVVVVDGIVLVVLIALAVPLAALFAYLNLLNFGVGSTVTVSLSPASGLTVNTRRFANFTAALVSF